MVKQFEVSVITRGVMGESILCFTIQVEAKEQSEAKTKAKGIIFTSEWMTKKYLEEGAKMDCRQMNDTS